MIPNGTERLCNALHNRDAGPDDYLPTAAERLRNIAADRIAALVEQNKEIKREMRDRTLKLEALVAVGKEMADLLEEFQPLGVVLVKKWRSLEGK